MYYYKLITYLKKKREERMTLKNLEGEIESLKKEKDRLIKCAVAWCEKLGGKRISDALEIHLRKEEEEK